MLRSRILFLVALGALSAGGSAAYAGTRSPAQKHPAAKARYVAPNLHYPCHSPGARLSPARL